MKNTVCLVLFIALLIGFASCSKEEASHPLEDSWLLASTSGGIHGRGYTANFDKLTIDADYNFELTDNGALIANGKITEQEHEFHDFFIEFKADAVNTTEPIDLISDPFKRVNIEADTLWLSSDLSDGFNTHFIRQ